MSDEPREAGTSARVLLNEVRADLEREDRDAIRLAKLWILFRLVVILAVLFYMNWISGPLSRMTPEELTRVASVKLEQRLPEARGRLRDYALSEASAAARQAHSLLIEVPTHLRGVVESRLLGGIDESIRRFETEIESWLTAAPLTLSTSAAADASISIRLEPAAKTIDGWYDASSADGRSLDGYIARLQRGVGLSDAESLDRRLIEAWIALIERGLDPPHEGRLEQARRDF